MTAHVRNDEPVRILIRKQSLDLLDRALALRNSPRIYSAEPIKRAQSSIRKVISFVEILNISGFVSVQNAQSLIEALDELGSLLFTSQRSSLSEEITLSREELIPRIRVEERKQAAKSRSSIRASEAGNTSKSVKDMSESKPALILDGLGLGIRSERILDILKSGNFFGIRDIVSNLPEYSEKMVQRELSTLIAMNKVRKAGAKRWSKYAIV